MSKKKSAELLPKIIACKTKEEAVAVLTEAFKMLHLTSDYNDLVALKDTLDVHKKELQSIQNEFSDLEVPRKYLDIHNTRLALNFLYMQVSDDLSFEVNKLKVYYGDDRRSEVKASSAEAVRRRLEEEAKAAAKKGPSHALVMDIYAAEPSYKEFVVMKSFSYGLYKELDNLLTAIIKFSDSVSSEESYLRNIEARNA